MIDISNPKRYCPVPSCFSVALLICIYVCNYNLFPMYWVVQFACSLSHFHGRPARHSCLYVYVYLFVLWHCKCLITCHCFSSSCSFFVSSVVNTPDHDCLPCLAHCVLTALPILNNSGRPECQPPQFIFTEVLSAVVVGDVEWYWWGKMPHLR